MEERTNAPAPLTDEERTITINTKNGPTQIYVYSIVPGLHEHKYIVYAMKNDDNAIYASILNLQTGAVSLDAIEAPDEVAFVNTYIDALEKALDENAAGAEGDKA